MKNGNDPAMPVFPDTSAGHAAAHIGLTKREYFTIEIAKGIISNPALFDVLNQEDSLAAYSIIHADALLKKLEETK